jgi:hypothetical protein
MSDNTHASTAVFRRTTSRERANFGFSRTSFLTSAAAQRSQQSSIATVWWSQTGSNRRPPACKAGALPTELWPLSEGPPSLKLRRATFAVRRMACQPKRRQPRRLVGLGRFELPTSRLSSARSNQLSYKPGFGRRMTDDGGQIFASSVVRHLSSVVCPELLVREEREMKTAVSRK